MSKTSPGTPSYVSSPKRIASQLSIASNNYLDSSAGDSSLSRPSSDYNQSPNLVIDGDNLIRTVSREEVEPWEAFKWTPLVKISDQLHSDAIKQESGLISVMTVSGVIAIGTTRSLVFVYDYSQNLKCILGDSTRGTYC
jgi:hypothetical protein